MIYKFLKIITIALYLIKICIQFYKKDYKSWEERYKENELYTILDFWKKDKKRMKKKFIIGIGVSFVVKIITKIQIRIGFILIIPSFLELIECKKTDNIIRKIFLEIPIAYCEVIKETMMSKKINKDDKKSLINNFIFVQIYLRSRWNILITIDVTKMIINIIEKDPRIKEKNYLKAIKIHGEQILKQNFNETIEKRLKKKNKKTQP